MMRKLLNMIFNILLVFIILISLLYITSSLYARNNPLHIPSVFGYAPLTVVSGSMSPGIETGDMVIIKKGNTDIKQGDVVTYRLDNILVTHRIKRISLQNAVEVFVTQGDANTIPDYKTVERSQVVGRYVVRIPMGGYIKASLQGLPGLMLLAGLMLIGIMTRVLNMTTVKVREAENSIV